MNPKQTVFRVRRSYNQWVNNQTLEDYALRFTAKKSRKLSLGQIAHTALGSISFLALEAIGAAITLNYGFHSAVLAIATVSLIIFFMAIPICYHAAKEGLDIDLLTRGAGFGYIGSTITSLIYASFTFIFFALEAAIMASALKWVFGIPLMIGYVICALAVIPLVTHGITFISRFQRITQYIWLPLQITPLLFILFLHPEFLNDWINFSAVDTTVSHINIHHFGAACAVIFALVAQIGEQVDYLRFMPAQKTTRSSRWWLTLFAAGPGWILIGACKMLLGSLLATLAFGAGLSLDEAADPTRMYAIAFGYVVPVPAIAAFIAALFVIVAQLKINVTNAYAGSIAWSNFFSRLTHSHPGRVVWLVFNVVIALVLMELGIYQAFEHILGAYALLAIAWLGALVGDLAINKPLGFSPKRIEFMRAYLFAINPVGVGAMLGAAIVGLLSFMGVFGATTQSLSHFITLATALLLAPVIALLTGAKYYIARPRLHQNPVLLPVTIHNAAIHNTTNNNTTIQNANIENKNLIARSSPSLDASHLAPYQQHFLSLQGNPQCCICENHYEPEDIALCPAYEGPICSLCCSLDARCGDICKPKTQFLVETTHALNRYLPTALKEFLSPRLLQFLGLMTFAILISGSLLSVIYVNAIELQAINSDAIATVLVQVFFVLQIALGVVAWLFVLANDSRKVAIEETRIQTQRLMDEVAAHDETDKKLQLAKEHAEAANNAKSRYLTGLSHELRTPLNSILGYAQLLEQDNAINDKNRRQVAVIKRSGEHLADLIEGLLDISKIEAGRLDIHRNEVAIKELIEQLKDMFRPQAGAKGLSFTLQYLSALPKLVATDEKRLRQILINLLSNAIKYTHQGSVEFTVRYRNQVAEFCIIDTGIGIPEAERERIFKPFERVLVPGAPQVIGTGLGLTITRLLVDIMGGDLQFYTNAHGGTTFVVSLMLSALHKGQTQVMPVKVIQGYQGEGKNILVVDDDPFHRGLLFETLTPLGFHLQEAPDAEYAIQNIALQDIDFFILDVNLPQMSGWELALYLRAQQLKAPIIMVSADANEGKSLPQEPHDGYLIKPIKIADLLKTIEQLLQLQWLYKTEPTAAITPTTAISKEKVPLLKLLLDHADSGNLNALKTTLEKAPITPQTTLLKVELKPLIDRFELNKIIQYLEQKIHEHQPKQ